MGVKISEKQEMKRQKIVDVAGRLFVKKGVGRTSLADIARELGISKGTLYYYYSTKNDLIFDITAHHMRQITDDLFALMDAGNGETSLGEVLTMLVETILNAKTRSMLHLHLIREAMTGNHALQERFEKTYQEWFALTIEGFEKIIPDGKEFAILAPILVAALDGFVIQSTLGVQRVRVADIVRVLERMISD